MKTNEDIKNHILDMLDGFNVRAWDGLYELEHEIVKALDNKDSSNQWVSVDKIKPQKDFLVICCCDDDVTICIYRGDEVFTEWSNNIRFQATHWQPLPKPPKEI